jgi:hypothetical protein
VVAALVVAAAAAWLGRAWNESRVPGSFGALDLARTELGGGPPLEEHAHHQTVSVDALHGPAGAPDERFRLVAEHADVWHAFGGVDVYRHKAEVLAGHCADVGRDPGDIAHAWDVRAERIEDAEGLRAAGVTRFVTEATPRDGRYDFGHVRELLAWRDAQRG